MKSNANNEVVYSYIVNKGFLPFETTHANMLQEINSSLPPRNHISLQQLRSALEYLKKTEKVTISNLRYGLLVTPYYIVEDSENEQPKKGLKSLFRKELNYTQWRIVDYMEANMVGEDNAQFGAQFKDGVNRTIKEGYEKIKSGSELRENLAVIKRSRIFKRRINSSPNKGYWLALEDEKHNVGFATRKALNAIATDVANHTNINIYYDFLNKLTTEIAIHKQGRFTFGTEKDQIDVYSDDLA
jgi:hypothetical protein